MICDRCHKESGGSIGSMFNMEQICFECKDKEQKHPDYERAAKVEADHVRQGDYNFRGVGLPADLR
jgi:hypothetical protein